MVEKRNVAIVRRGSSQLLEKFKDGKNHLAIVRNNKGEVLGI